MGKIIIQGNANGGIDPEDISARAADVLKGKTTINEDGEVVEGKIVSIPSVSNSLDRAAYGNDNLYVTIQNGAYINNSWTGHPEIAIHKDKLVKALGIDEKKMLDSLSIAGVRGNIPISKTNKNHVKTMEIGHAWGDDRGLMYVIRIDEGQYVPLVSQGGYAYVGVKEPDLRPENIRQGVVIGRVTGTMPDYASQQTVFDGASFFGFMKNGAIYKTTKLEKFFGNSTMMWNHDKADVGYSLEGIRHRNGVFWCDFKASRRNFSYAGFVTYNSIPLFLIRTIRLTLTVNIYGQEPSFEHVRASLRFVNCKGKERDFLPVWSNTQDRDFTKGTQTLDFDISNINEWAFIFFNFETSANAWESTTGAFVVNRIEFLR